ncbi:MAG: putative inorganic carbon transporter subunit DabA [Fuerstiella sp.]
MSIVLCGRHQWSRDLYLDLQAFLTSYDPTHDGKDSAILEQLLRAVIPVCAGISLKCYFSTVDNEAYGCRNQLPHNRTWLSSVKTGHPAICGFDGPHKW